MNLPSLLRLKTFRRRGMALVIVIGALALATMLLLAMFSLTETEYRSTQSYTAALSAKQYGDGAVEVVKAQIMHGSFASDANGNPITGAAARTIHATQPGMIRVYQANGTFSGAYRLYSSSQMYVQGPLEASIFSAATTAPQDWDTMPARFVDLNEPVVRPALGNGVTSGNGVSLYFPIIDPRAAFNYVGQQYSPQNPADLGEQTTQVEGFWYEKATPGGGSAASVTYKTVMRPTDVGGNSSLLRLPMPVEWMYFLQDGTMGTLDATNHFVGPTPTAVPNVNNPIVARVAFWTDDESCKLNINTASEPTFMAPPYYYHMRDSKWANFPAASSEYQRYPGHPATVALSTVLAPNYRLDPYRPQDDHLADAQSVVQIKEAIYDLAPKISMGGSLAGTVPFVTDDFSNYNKETTGPSSAVSTAVARAERLYASVDEMLFRDLDYNQTTGRMPAKFNFPGTARVMFDHDTLERSRFFLTAHSRAPEFSMFGLPRICIWPVAEGEQLNNKKRTNFDNLIALCSTLRSAQAGGGVDRSYFFRRSDAHHSVYDVTGMTGNKPHSDGLARNTNLLDYLVAQMSNLNWPQTSTTGGNSQNYLAKYGVDNVRQLAVQFFDYVRCTNLYDGILARNQDGTKSKTSAGKTAQEQAYYKRDSVADDLYTFTEMRVTPAATNLGADARSKLVQKAAADASVLPGHGQVSPAIYSKGGTAYMGFGRMFTISEMGWHFICTADGLNDRYAVDFKKGGNSIKSGGGTAYRTDPQLDAQQNGYQPVYQPSVSAYNGYTLERSGADDKAVWWSNFPPLGEKGDPARGGSLKYGCNLEDPKWHPIRHPGYNPEYWNMTLAYDTPLMQDEKRIQGIFLMETFCPMMGWTKFHPEYTIVLKGGFINQIKITSAGKEHRPFDTVGDIPVKSNGNLYEADGVHSMGGHAGPSAVVGNRGGREISGEVGEDGMDPSDGVRTGGNVSMGADQAYKTDNVDGHNALANYGVTSNFFTVKRNQPMTIEFPNKPMEIWIYDKHLSTTQPALLPIQKIAVKFPPAQTPTPSLVYNNYTIAAEGKGGVAGRELNYWSEVDKFGQIKYRRSTQGPHYWVFNNEGCLSRMTGRVNPGWPNAGPGFWATGNPTPYDPAANPSPVRQMLKGRLNVDKPAQWGPPGTAQGISIIPPESDGFESDVIRTIVPAVGDYRMVAARYLVPPELWMPHPDWGTGLNTERSIHTFSQFWGDYENGYNLPPGLDKRLLVGGVNFGPTGGTANYSRTPDLPPSVEWGAAANSYGDFDSGISNAREGPYINKPDEGNFYAAEFTRNNIKKFYRSGYFFESWHNSDDWRSGIYMTPNRMISSPVMFGSLPTGVFNTGGNGAPTALTGTSLTSMPCRPWQTLLFRPYVLSNQSAYGSKALHPGDSGPKDHFLLDMFFMPVVEPYAISEPLSVAGRLNMNYQIVPFTNITRATGMWAAMKGEFVTAIPNGDIYNSKTFKQSPNTQLVWDIHFDETTSPKKFWHRRINVIETLKQFEERFNMTLGGKDNGLFRSASQICEMHLIPDVTQATELGGEFNPTMVNIKTPTARKSAMQTFWQNHAATGDNVRERPYSNLYSRLTTRSNTFRVHVRSQVLKKARSTDPTMFDPARDAILSEFRGSTLIERYIDPNNPDPDNPGIPLPDYATAANPVALRPLDSYYRFRVLESKRFNP